MIADVSDDHGMYIVDRYVTRNHNTMCSLYDPLQRQKRGKSMSEKQVRTRLFTDGDID